MVYIVHMAFITCGIWHLHAMAHFIASCTETLHFMGVGAWLESNTTIGDLVGGFGTVGQSPTKSHGFIIARRARHSLK